MNHRRLAVGVTALVFCFGFFNTTLAQPLRSSTEPGVWSKNMELLAPLNWRGSDPVIMQEIICNNAIARTTVHCLIGVTITRYQADMTEGNADQWSSHVSITDIGDPRAPIQWLMIRGWKDANASHRSREYAIDFSNIAVWTDPASQHAFAIVYVKDVIVGTDAYNQDIHARFLLFDLTAALTHANDEAVSTIVLADPKNRSVEIGTGTYTDVYIGYIEQDGKYLSNGVTADGLVYSMTVEPHSGLLAVSPEYYSGLGTSAYPWRSFIDCFDLSTISSNANYSSATNFVHGIRRLTASEGQTDPGPPTVSIDGTLDSIASGDDDYPVARDVFLEYVSSHVVRLYIGTSLQEVTGHSPVSPNTEYLGDCRTAVVDFSQTPSLNRPGEALQFNL
jgi:hypothetical protein